MSSNASWWGREGRYLEVELGAGGHYLILGFAGPRDLVEPHTAFRPSLAFESDADGWHSAVTLPWDVLPSSLCAINVFIIVGDVHLAFRAVPGETPDFHQPAGFPRLQLTRD
jgi:hypothetical protein